MFVLARIICAKKAPPLSCDQSTNHMLNLLCIWKVKKGKRSRLSRMMSWQHNKRNQIGILPRVLHELNKTGFIRGEHLMTLCTFVVLIKCASLFSAWGTDAVAERRKKQITTTMHTLIHESRLFFDLHDLLNWNSLHFQWKQPAQSSCLSTQASEPGET